MFNHAPDDYDCPFCRLAHGLDTDISTQDDVVYRNDDICAFMSAGWWPNNQGHVLIVTNEHYENIYDLPPALAAPIQYMARELAFAFKAIYSAHGVSTRNHNEPAGMQDVWHYHLHVFPRYEDDNLYLAERMHSSPEQRKPYGERLREFLAHRSD